MVNSVTIFAIFGCLVFGYLTSGFATAEIWSDITEVADEINSINCQEGLSLNFSDAYITRIGEHFIKSPSVKCIDIINNHLQNIEQGAFESLANLMYLNISFNDLETENLLFFGGYKSLKILSIDYASRSNSKHLRVSKLYPELRYLSLRGNTVYGVSYRNKTYNPYYYDNPDESILKALPKIIYMDLSQNSMEQVDLSFHGTLKYLYLQQNKLYAVNVQSLSNLLVLNVDYNILSRITYDESYDSISLKGLTKLKQLSVANNRVYVIRSNSFSDTRELISLNLTNNQLGSIDSKTFSPLQFLEDLILDNNQLQDIPDVTSNTDIRVLSLHNNRIRSIPDRIFISSSSLEELNLAENLIEHVDVGAFHGLQRLEYLNLAKNKLSSLPENWCASLINLHFLDLSFNFFTSLNSLSLMNVMPLQQLNLYYHKLKYIHAPFVRNLPENVTINLSDESG